MIKLLLAALLSVILPTSTADVTVLYSWHGTLVIGTVQRVTFTFPQCSRLYVANRGSSLQDIYVRWDDVDPIVNGDGSFVVMGNTSREFNVGNYYSALTARLVSSAAPQVSAECIN